MDKGRTNQVKVIAENRAKSVTVCIIYNTVQGTGSCTSNHVTPVLRHSKFVGKLINDYFGIHRSKVHTVTRR